MWPVFFVLSISSLLFFGMLAKSIDLTRRNKKRKVRLFHMLFMGVFMAAFFMFLPLHIVRTDNGIIEAVVLSLFNSMQIFTLGTEFDIVRNNIHACADWLAPYYRIWVAMVFIIAPVFTFSFVLSFFENISAFTRYLCMYFKKVYIFSELNEKSLALATDIHNKDKKAGIVFNDVFRQEEEKHFELQEKAKQIGAVCFKHDILAVAFGRHAASKDIYFFTIGENETENFDQTLRLVERYRTRKNTHLYVFSTRIESELLLNALEKGEVKTRRINHVQSLIDRILYERGQIIFQNAIPANDGVKQISAVLVGLGYHGTEMLKALSWFGQMDGYRIKITAFDKDPLAEERFKARAPELMSEDYNGVFVEGEAQYSIRICSGYDVQTAAFASEIGQLTDATYVFVSLGSDDMNIRTAIELRALFERMGIAPTIQAVLSNSQQKQALSGIKSCDNRAYNIEFIGDVVSSFAQDVIIDSELEEDALERHKKWGGSEDAFWMYEYHYRSSVATAIHMKARAGCQIPGADKDEKAQSPEEQRIIAALEHRRWNAYMRAEGYVYRDAKRNDMAKIHPSLVRFDSLSDSQKQIDISIGSK